MNCNECKHYRWYYDYCEKWCCEVDGREVHNCFEPMETPILDAMTNLKGALQASFNLSTGAASVAPTYKGATMSNDELLSMMESYLEDHESSELLRVVADAIESMGH